ncbi:hypothetical protein G6F56_001779 [Rhizopus delemar]|nr:hypothetical protein G6F56_001779 [Rhizopus delemar]
MSTKRRQSSTYSAEEPFEFVDYTSVSNFERLVTQIENIISSWGLKDGAYGIFSNKLSVSEDYTKRNVISIGDEVFHLTYHYQPTATENDNFPLAAEDFYRFDYLQHHPLHRWTGKNRFLILNSVNDSIKKRLFLGGRSSIEIHQAKYLISACATAFQNTGCRVPAFTPMGQEYHNMYIGYMHTLTNEEHPLNYTEVRYNMTVVTPPSALSCLDELKALFIQKLNAQREDYGKTEYNDDDVWTTAVYTYDLKNWFESNWKTWPETEGVDNSTEEFDSLSRTPETLKRPLDEHRLPFGSYNDPLRSLTLSALFPFWKDEFYDDSQSTNMDALTAKRWILSREFAPRNQQRADLSTLIEQIIGSWIKDPSNREYLAPYDEDNDESNESSHNDIFSANSTPLSSSASDNSVGLKIGDDQVTVVKSDQVEEVLSQLFSTSYAGDVPVCDKAFLHTKNLALKLKSNSSIPFRSFLWDLLFFTIEAVSNNNSSPSSRRQNSTDFFGFLRIVWIEVLRKIRWHWENLIPIPKLNPFLYESDEKLDTTLGIDLRYSILHQKISMINCCIHRKLQSQNNKDSPGYEDKASLNVADSKKHFTIEDSDSTDEFFDTVEDTDSSSNIDQPSMDGEVIERAHPLAGSYVRLPFIAQFNNEESDAAVIKDMDMFEGRLNEHSEGLKLLKTNEPLFVPVTQDSGFMTEDMIREQAEVFENMGSSDCATIKRAQLQSQQLYSDMQSFKAANPHACLEDFVRWHSPRDWIVPEGKENEEGLLSKRMSESNNIWQELWNCSRRIPCSRQKPLFDIYAEVEKAIKFLEALSVHELFAFMLPTLGLIAYDTLSTHPVTDCSNYVAHKLSLFGNELISFPWDDLRNGKQSFNEIITDIRELESSMCNAITLLRKLPRQYDLVDRLLSSNQAIVNEGRERATVFQLFKNDDGIISKPSFKEI